MIELIETYSEGGTNGVVTGGKVVVEIIHKPAQYVASELKYRPAPRSERVYLYKTKAFTIPEQYRVVVRDAAGYVQWEDRRRFLSYDKAATAALNKAKRGL